MRAWVRSEILLVAVCTFGVVPALAVARPVQVCVQDERGSVVAGARVKVLGDSSQAGVSDGGGCVVVNADANAVVEIARDGFDRVVRALGDQAQVMVVMQLAEAVEEVEVTAARSPLALDASASSVRTMTGEQLREAPGFTLDDRLRQVAGFQLFRRTSSWVANPTTEGTTLRGLGSTAAS
jgi:hypothetical protein